MKKSILLLSILLSNCILVMAQKNPVDCEKFHRGSFAFRDSISNTIWQIKRTAKHQTEKDEKTGAIIKHKIEWINPCEYKLTQVWTNRKEYKSGNYKGRIYSIVSTNGDTYTYSCNCNDNLKVGGVVVKLPG
jgi:hypothetical protein